MTPHSFFLIFIKLLGVYLLWQAITLVLNVIGTIGVAVQPGENDILILAIITGAGIIALVVIALRLCLFRPDIIINKLALDQGFKEERFEINIHRSTVLTLAVIVTGALVLVDSVPSLCHYFLAYVKESKFNGSSPKIYLGLYTVKSLIGYLLVSNNRRIVALIEQRRANRAP